MDNLLLERLRRLMPEVDWRGAALGNHSGGFYGMNGVYTDEFVRACESRLKQAADAVKGADAVYAERVALHAAGFANVTDYRAIGDAMARGDFVAAARFLELLRS